MTAADEVSGAEDLFAPSLEDFTPARNRLARELAKRGDRSEAERVKALRKPSRPAWLANQLARRRPDEARQLLDAGEQLRAAQEKLLEGGSREPLDRAVEAEREAVAALLGAAPEVAASLGHEPNAATLDRVGATLHAVALDAEVRRGFEGGTLAEDRASTGIDELSLLAVRPRKRTAPRMQPARKKTARTRQGPSAGEAKRLREAEAKEASLAEEVEQARGELRATQKRLKSLEAKLTRARMATARARETITRD